MGDLVHNCYRKSAVTKFIAVNCDDVDDAISIFGNFTEQGDTPIVCMPYRSWWKPYITIPEGTYAVVTKHGNFQGVWNPGFHWCMPYTSIQFLVTQQNFQFDVPVRNCPTIDNIYVQIEVAIVMRVMEGEENIKNFVYKTSVNQLNEQLDAAISERIRVLARSKTHLEAYSIKGKEKQQEHTEYMNGIFESKGIEIRSVIITNVKLQTEIADQLEEKTTYASKNTLERKQQCFELRVINDDQEYNQRKEKMKQQRESEKEEFNRLKAQIDKDYEKIQADTAKMIAEIHEKTTAEVNKIGAQSELDAEEVKAETKMIRASFMADGRAKFNKVVAEAEAYVMKKEAEAKQQSAQKIAEEIRIRGKAETSLAKNLSNRRSHEEKMAQLGILQDLALNDKLSVFGDHKDNMMAQLAAFKVFGDNSHS
jgi:regulator of protease activity HflC (stomatin/prohibitin superfamily)